MRGVVSNLRGLQSAIQDVGRLRSIARVLVRHGFGAIVARLRLGEVLGGRGVPDAATAEPGRFTTAERIRRVIEELGPTYIKLGQILSTRSDLLPPEVLAELQHLQDDVPPMSWEEAARQVEQELDGPIDTLFASFERTPLACASIAQVHRATLRDGVAVVVKVQRPGIARQIASDLSILDFLARRAEALVPELGLMDPVGMVGEFDRAIRKELDFATEREHILRFQKNFEGFEGLRIPRVFDAYSTRGVLAMDLVEGVKCTRAPEEFGIDPEDLAPRMLRIVLKMIFRDGFFHGDLHPGNILVDRDGTIGLIDFGLAGRLTPKQRETILDVLIGMAREDYALIARVFFEIGVKMPGVGYDFGAFEADVTQIMESHFAGKTLAEVDIGAFFADLVGGAVKHQIKMPPAYTMVFKALVTVEGIGKTLTPDLHLIEEAQPFVSEILLERYSPRKVVQEGVKTLSGVTDFLRTFPPVANQILRDAEQGRFAIRTDIQSAPALLEEQRKSSERIARAVLVAGFVLAGVLAAGGPSFGSILGFPTLTLGFFALAGLMGRPFVPFLFRR